MVLFDNGVTLIASALGAILIVVALVKIGRTLPEKWPIVGVLGIGAFLLVGSQYKSFKVSETGIEALRNEVAATADAAETVAAQAEQAASAAQTTRAQVDQLTTLLDQRQVLPPDATRSIRTNLQQAPQIDLGRLKAARSVLDRVRKQ
jgi:hypothetical protein